jgi:hypothetical protein
MSRVFLATVAISFSTTVSDMSALDALDALDVDLHVFL